MDGPNNPTLSARRFAALSCFDENQQHHLGLSWRAKKVINA
jgi:hypothetical protein